ncbi:MAG: hypothetical protein RL722_118 [Pseudomonadota bacterium]|jgi:filamentous hemagglutinin family protein
MSAVPRQVPATFRPHPVSLAAALLLAMPLAVALPVDPSLTSGQATVHQTSPQQLDIVQGSARAGLDWRSFSIARGEKVIVSQPGRDAVLLNRVLGNDPSLIFGSLQANGQVWLINPRGIVFGATAEVDVGGLLASTLGLAGPVGEALAPGRLTLSRGEAMPGDLRQAGTIWAPGGSVVFVAPQIEQTGQVSAGRIALAAASHVQVDVEGDGLVIFNARNDGSLPARLAQLGSLKADGGSVELRATARAGFADTVLNLDGVVQARSLGQRGGQVIVDGGRSGNTLIGGHIDASGQAAGEQGGAVTLLGQQLALTEGARIDASGPSGGGLVRVGGDYQGGHATVGTPASSYSLPNARLTVVQRGARIQADAGVRGDGGRVIIWSDQGTRFEGTVSARGGAQGGQGGFAEVSGKQGLDFRGQVDLSAPRGRRGTLLLDPLNLTIQDNAPDIDGTASNVDLATPTLTFADFAGINSIITKGAVNAQLANAAVELQASNDISVSASAAGPNLALSGPNSLTLRAGRNIDIAAPISTQGLILSAHDAGAAPATTAGRVSTTAALDAGSGLMRITSNGGNDVHLLAAPLSAGSLVLDGASTVTAPVTATAGSISLDRGAASLGNGGSLNTPELRLTGGSLTTSASEQISDDAAVSVASGTTLTVGGAEAINTLELAGSLTGTGSLSATTSTSLTGGTVNATLSTPLLDSSGVSSINAAVSATTSATVTGGGLSMGTGGSLASPVVALTGGNLSTSANEQISDDAAVSVASGTTLTMGGTETINTLALAGILTGTGSLNATTSASLTGGTVNAALNSPLLSSSGVSNINAAVSATTSATVAGGSLSLGAGGSLASPVVALTGGNLSTSADEQISNNAAVNVASGTTLTVGGAETISTLSLAGTLVGPGSLSAATSASLTDGTVETALSTPLLSSSGVSSINAAVSAATSATLTGGSLSLGAGGSLTTPTVSLLTGGNLSTTANEQISDNAAISAFSGATLTVGGTETINTLSLAGILTGTGILNTATSTTLTGGSVNAALSTPVLDSGGASSINAAVSASTSVSINGGSLDINTAGLLSSPSIRVNSAATLSTSGSGQIGSSSALALANNASVVLGGSQTIAALSDIGVADGSSRVDLGSNGLSMGGLGTSSSFGGVISGGTSSALTKAGSGTLTLNAANTYAGSTTVIGGGNLILGSASTLASGTVDVIAGQLQTSAPQQLATTTRLSAGSTGSLLLGGNQTVASLDLAGNLSASGASTLNTTGATNLLGGSVNMALNAATLTSAGSSTLNAVVTTPGLTVTGGNLTLSSAGQLAGTTSVNINGGSLTAQRVGATVDQIPDAASVAVGSGASLVLAGPETVSALLLSGSLSGAGRLNVGTLASLNGGTVHVPLDTASLDSHGTSSLFAPVTASSAATVLDGQLTLDLGASLTTPTVTVVTGRLATTAPDQLLGGAAVNVLGPAFLRVAGTETVNQLTLAGTLEGSGALTASNLVSLTGGMVNAALTTPLLNSSGDSTLQAQTTATGSSTLAGGVLTLGTGGSLVTPRAAVNSGATLRTTRNEQIADTTQLGVASGGLLHIGGDERIAQLDLAGLAQGPGKLSVSGATGLAGGTVALPLLTDTLDSSGSALIRAPVDAATRAQVSGGLLRVDAGGALATPLLDVNAGELQVGTAAQVTTPALNVRAGRLTTEAADLLSDNAVVSVAGGASWSLAGSDTIRALNLAGTLVDASPGGGTRLTSTEAAGLNGGTLGVALTTLNFSSSGVSAVNAAVQATGAATISGGRLSLGDGGTVGPSGSLDTPLLRIDAGSLVTHRSEQVGDQALVQLANRANLVLNGSETLRALADKPGELVDGTALVDLGNPGLPGRTLTLANASGSQSYGGGLSGGSLVQLHKSGTGQQGFGGQLDHGGDTVIDAGSLVLEPGGAIGATTQVLVQPGGQLLTSTSEQINNAAALVVQGGASVSLAGHETVASLALAGSLQGDGTLDVSGASVLTGGQVGAALLTRSLDSRGNSLLLAPTRVSSDVSVSDGVLILGTGGSLAAATPGARYAVAVNGGALRTSSAGQLLDRPALTMATGSSLDLAGAEALDSIDARGAVSLGGDLSTTQAMTLAGPVNGRTDLSLRSGGALQADHADNQWAGRLGLDAQGPVAVSAGVSGGTPSDLTLGVVHLRAGGQIDAGVLTLGDNLTLEAGTLTLHGLASALPGPGDPPALTNVLTPGQHALRWARDVVLQTGVGHIDVAAGALLSVRADDGGSVRLGQDGNRFLGGLEVISGRSRSAWNERLVTQGSGQVAVQSRVQLAAGQLNVAGQGLEADVLDLSADAITTARPTANVADWAVITARMPFNAGLSGAQQLPALTLHATAAGQAAAAAGGHPYGVAGAGGELQVNVGSRSWGTTASGGERGGLNAGYIAVLPQPTSPGSLSVVLSGPEFGVDGYAFYSLGEGLDGSIPVFYNGRGTRTARETISLGSTLSVVESARKERFDDAVRTENVAMRLRQGVIAEVGPGRPATQGTEGLRPPLSCPPAALSLSCEP